MRRLNLGEVDFVGCRASKNTLPRLLHPSKISSIARKWYACTLEAAEATTIISRGLAQSWYCNKPLAVTRLSQRAASKTSPTCRNLPSPAKVCKRTMICDECQKLLDPKHRVNYSGNSSDFHIMRLGAPGVEVFHPRSIAQLKASSVSCKICKTLLRRLPAEAVDVAQATHISFWRHSVLQQPSKGFAFYTTCVSPSAFTEQRTPLSLRSSYQILAMTMLGRIVWQYDWTGWVQEE